MAAVDPLAILFGSASRVKLLRFFLFNPSKEFTFDEISRRARLVRRTARTEMDALERAGIVRRKQSFVEEEGKDVKTKAEVYLLDTKFPELLALQTFLFETAPLDGKTLQRHLKNAGLVEFLVVAGVFVRDFEHRIDVMVSMKKLDEKKLENAIKTLESELGMEIRIAAFSSEDMLYRVGMYDKLIRDIFDFDHIVLVDKLGIEDEVRR